MPRCGAMDDQSRRRSRARRPTKKTGARSNPPANRTTGETRQTAATPPNAGAAQEHASSQHERKDSQRRLRRGVPPEDEREAHDLQPEPEPAALLPFFCQVPGHGHRAIGRRKQREQPLNRVVTHVHLAPASDHPAVARTPATNGSAPPSPAAVTVTWRFALPPRCGVGSLMRDVIRPLVSRRSRAVYSAPGATVRPARSASSARMVTP